MTETTHTVGLVAEIVERLEVIDRRFYATDKFLQMEVHQITSRIDALVRDLDARVDEVEQGLQGIMTARGARLDEIEQGLKALTTARGTTERELRDTVARQREEIGFLLSRIDEARDRHAAQFAEELAAIRAGNTP